MVAVFMLCFSLYMCYSHERRVDKELAAKQTRLTSSISDRALIELEALLEFRGSKRVLSVEHAFVMGVQRRDPNVRFVVLSDVSRQD